MNNKYCLAQVSKTRRLDAYSIARQYNIDLMSEFVVLKDHYPKFTQKQAAQQLG